MGNGFPISDDYHISTHNIFIEETLFQCELLLVIMIKLLLLYLG